MKRFSVLLTALAPVAVAAFALPSSGLAVTGSTTCAAAGTPGFTYDGTPTTDVINSTVASNFTLPAGAPLCRVFGAEIQGNTSVGGNLAVFGGTFDKNVTVNGGSFAAVNHGVTIKGNLSLINPAANRDSGFWPTDGVNQVQGNLSFTLDGTVSYACYTWPGLYLGQLVLGTGGTTGNFSYTGYANKLYDAGLTGGGSRSLTYLPPQAGC